MKLIIIRDNFKKGLIIIEKIAGKNFSLPILDNVLIKTFQNFLTLSGTIGGKKPNELKNRSTSFLAADLPILITCRV